MTWVDRLFGTGQTKRRPTTEQPERAARDDDLSRYRRFVRSASRETLERAHVEAFSSLDVDERRRIAATLVDAMPPQERAAAPLVSVTEPEALAKLSTSAELREPGGLERTLVDRNQRVLFAAFVGSLLAGAAATRFLEAEAGAAPSAEAPESDPDFSPEYGQGAHGDGYAGGAGFEHDEFDFEV
ncbi:MAG TPA: hypothetical protein VKY73_02590 [Polyangiaceae bacterium]|nr:hypothetical protein [Polyangiaceae bacterium]